MRRTPYQIKYLAFVPLMAILLALPFFATAYLLVFFFMMFAYIVLAECYDLLGGYGGYVNLGIATFFGIGAYIFEILYRSPDPLVKSGFNLPAPVAFVISVLVVLALAVGVSYPFFRLRGAYFSISTLGLLLLMFYLATNLHSITGGYRGLSIQLIPDARFITYYMGLAVVLASIMTFRKIIRGKLGLALSSIKEDEDVAEVFGIDAYRCKTQALIISAFFAGLMGEIYAINMAYVSPAAAFGLEIGLAPIVMAMLGGSGIFLGPTVGAAVMMIIQEFIFLKTPYLHLFIYGIIMVIIGLFLPSGIVGIFFSHIRPRLSRGSKTH